MINKRFDEIDVNDITRLVQEGTPEGRTLEYKEVLPGNASDDKKEFLADICAFANGAGGDLLYGILEQRDGDGKTTGIPAEERGLAGINADEAILRLDNLIRDGIAPRVPVQIRVLEGFPNGPVIMIRISRSWATPHMVIFRNTSRFYTRNSAGKHQLDVGEIRAAFAASEVLPERIQRFRTDRLAKIIANETPVPLLPNPKVVLHVAPISAFDPQNRIDISLQAKEFHQWINPLYSRWNYQRHNFDGYVTYTADRDDENRAYLQIFRNGALEAVDSRMLQPRRDGTRILPTVDVEGAAIKVLPQYFRLLEALELDPPILVMLSLLEVKDYIIPPRSGFFDEASPIDRNVLVIPDVLVENYGEDAATILRHAFDILWQAGGYAGSPNYDKEGKWRPRG